VSDLPFWLEPLYTADEMRALDAWAIEEQGVPSLELMERAGGEVARVVTALAPSGPVRAVCGKGNNGGDGLVVVRLLHGIGVAAEALLLSDPHDLSPDARANHARLAESGAPWRAIDAGGLPAALEGSGCVVDALLGTGFEGAPRAPLDGAIAAVNDSGSQVVAVDVPSGVNASTGEVEGAGVRADVTVTFHAAKVGLWVHPGKEHAGRVETVDIGIPVAWGGSPEPRTAGLIGARAPVRLAPRGPRSTKFSSGTVLVVGGSTGLTGAVCLTATGAMRAGAGWVRVAVPASLNPIFEVKLTEVMSVPLHDESGSLTLAAMDAVMEATGRADAVVLGPGLGREPDSLALAQGLAEQIEKPLLVDADGLNAIAESGLEVLAGRDVPTVLTPHAGELGRLLGRPSADVEARRLAAAREAAQRSGAFVVLKGDDTLVIDPDGRTAVSMGGSPGLATAGTGDVLSGIGAAFLAQGLDPFEAACAAVGVHAEAGRGAAEALGAGSMIAGDVVDALPAVMRRAAFGGAIGGASGRPSGSHGWGQ
jgi:ADP-dependent NAD(P)H-hydrate dehydratase / NAD(P)H-hydrate epimerase